MLHVAMDHLTPYASRQITALAPATKQGWRLKRYALMAGDRALDAHTVKAATRAAQRRLPPPGTLAQGSGNHGCGFQIIHFAQTAIVSPVFYWQWGSVLSSLTQLRAPRHAPTAFEDGYTEIVGCVWELEIVAFETQAWTQTVLAPGAPVADPITDYLKLSHPKATPSPGPIPEPEAKG